MLDLSSFECFEWDDANRTKNWLKHQVSAPECEEVFFNLPLLLSEDVQPSEVETQFYVIGQTNSGRTLFVSFTMRTNHVWVISARDMSRKERRTYVKANS